MFQWLKRIGKPVTQAQTPESLTVDEFELLLHAQYERIHNDTFSDDEDFDYFLTLTRGHEQQAFFMTVHALLCNAEVLIKTNEFSSEFRAIFPENMQKIDYQLVDNDTAQWIKERVSAVEKYISDQAEAGRAFIYDRKPEHNPSVTSRLMNAVSPADQEAFSKLVLNVLHNHRASDWEAARELNLELMRINPSKAEFIRSMQIINESAWIVINGKKQETIDLRMLTIEEQMRWLRFSLVTPETAKTIQDFVSQVRTQHKTTRFLNEAISIIEKANRLKTEGARKKRLDQASDFIRDGLQISPNNLALRTALNLIPLENIANLDLLKVAHSMSENVTKQN